MINISPYKIQLEVLNNYKMILKRAQDSNSSKSGLEQRKVRMKKDYFLQLS